MDELSLVLKGFFWGLSAAQGLCVEAECGFLGV